MSWVSASDSVDLGDHFCVLTASDEERAAAISTVVADGLAGGQLVMVLTSAAPPSTMADVLADRVPGATSALDRGQVRVLPAQEIYLTGGQFDPRVCATMAACIDEALRRGYAGLQVAADMTWVQSSEVDTADLVEYETAVNALALDGHASGACLYDQDATATDLMRVLIQSHPATTRRLPATPQLRLRRTREPYGITLVGEADVSNRRAVQSMLDTAVDGHSDRGGPLVVDLTGLQHADATIGASLVSLAERVPAGVRFVGCHGAVALLFEYLEFRHPLG
ncbi:MEDS domain-containing protein [Cryptosporangium minutisporangium]|uniref:STAS domain-containing protein n=1 Tax=Cryptosporangium minutisporangium TaxID=113569 RepID=A0ABP6SS39_9ACTN